MTHYTYKIGAVFYMLWGILHVALGAMALSKLSQGGLAAVLAIFGVDIPTAEVLERLPGVVNGVFAQHSWNIFWFGVFAFIVAAAFNWRNSRVGYWLNLSVVSAADLGFIFAIMIPGYIKFSDAILGPIFWILGVIFSTIGIVSQNAQTKNTA